ncbi:MAG: hypothetical protein MJ236_01220 [Clostridia bacterium]|nr:hypothetical protein [Clostridia bacterium]
MVKHRIILDVSKTGVQFTLPMNQTEFSSREIMISLRNDSEAVNLDGCSAALVVTYPDGTVSRPLACLCYGSNAYNANTIVVTLTSNMAEQNGAVKCVLLIASNEGGVLYSPSFVIQVAKIPGLVESIDEPGSTTANEFLAITQAKLEAQGWAVGSMGDGTTSSPTNNSKYYSEQSALHAGESNASAASSAEFASASSASAAEAEHQKELAHQQVIAAENQANRANEYLTQVQASEASSKSYSELSGNYANTASIKAKESADSAIESKEYKEYIESYISTTPPIIAPNGNWMIYNGTSYIDTGKSSIGKPFTIKKTYTSIEEMNRGFAADEVLEGEFVCITNGNMEDVDNAKLFVKGSYSYQYITDLSGSQGIKGDMGTVSIGSTETVAPNMPAKVTNVGTSTSAVLNFQIPQGVKGDRGYGITKVELISGDHTEGTKDKYRMTFENGYTFDYEVYNGANGEVQRSEFDALSNNVIQHSEAIVELQAVGIVNVNGILNIKFMEA